METIFKEFDITTTAVTALLVLDFILNNQRFVLEIDGVGERSRDGVMGSLALSHETFVALNDGDGRVLDLPFANVTECLAANGGLLSGFGWCPAF